MQRLFCTSLLGIFHLCAWAQNVGIGTDKPLQKLEINGAIRIGTSTDNLPGSIRFQNNRFEGGNGTSWLALEGLPAKAIILAQQPDTAFLKTIGFATLRSTDIWDTSYFQVPVNSPGVWTSGFPLSAGTTPVPGSFSAETVQYNGQFIYYGSDGFLYAYNINTDVWLKLPNVSPLGQRTGYGMSIIGNEIFITGGWRFVNPNFVIYNTAAKYNLTTNTWTTIANMPVTNCNHATVTSGTDLYFINGASTYSSGSFVNAKKLYRYSAASNTWSADLATAGTPDYIAPYLATGRNGKYLFSTSLVNSNSGNDYMTLVEFDPATQATTTITPSTPFPFSLLYQFRYSRPIVIGADKVLVMGYLPDSTDINYNPSNPSATSGTIQALFEVTISTGGAVALSACAIANEEIWNWQYFTGDQQVYARTNSGNYFVFNRSASGPCNVVLKRRGYWTYMKKN